MKQCTECKDSFSPEKEFHKLCWRCVYKKYHPNRCSECKGVLKGYYDDYFINGCHCDSIGDDYETF